MCITLACVSIRSSSEADNRVQNAVDYLESHLDTKVGLVYESEDPGIQAASGLHYNQTFWIYSDNLIATWALKPFAEQESKIINDTIQSYNLPPSEFFEVLFGDPIPLELLNETKLPINLTSDGMVMAEFHDEAVPLSQRDYGDTLIYESLNEFLRGNRTGAEEYFHDAYQMWDGKGIFDKATSTENGVFYANYKIALVLYAAKVLNVNSSVYVNLTEMEDTLWSMQSPATGGITALADANGNLSGFANAETTSMTLLVYNSELISRMQSLFASYPQPEIPSSGGAVDWSKVIFVVMVVSWILVLPAWVSSRYVKSRKFSSALQAASLMLLGIAVMTTLLIILMGASFVAPWG
jgi:hypothetical protein